MMSATDDIWHMHFKTDSRLLVSNKGAKAMPKKERAVFSLLWQMVNEINKFNTGATGMIVSRYASMIDDRIENSGNSRSVDSLKLYTTEQLEDELESRNAA